MASGAVRPVVVFQFVVNLFIALCNGRSQPSDFLNKTLLRDAAKYPENFRQDSVENGTDFYDGDIFKSMKLVLLYDELPPETARERTKEFAMEIDYSNDEFINAQELIDWIERSLRLQGQDIIHQRFHGKDKNGDKKVTWDEHMAETFGTPLRIPKKDLKVIDEDKRYFKLADINGDGVLNEEEFPKFCLPSEFKEMHEALYEETMKREDDNKDGVLSVEEFISVPLTALNKGKYMEEKRRFEEYDTNVDQTLDKKETMNSLFQRKEEFAKKMARYLIQYSDINKDGKISMREFVIKRKYFFGSEALDYGQHLYFARRLHMQV